MNKTPNYKKLMREPGRASIFYNFGLDLVIIIILINENGK